MDVIFFMSVFRLYPGLKKSFENNSFRKNLFLSACFCWDSRFSLCEIDQDCEYRWTIVMGTRTWSFYFVISKYLDYTQYYTGAVRARIGKGPGYCYMIGRGPNSSLLGHVSGLLFCLYVNVFLLSIFNSADFWNSLFLIALGIELTEKNIIKELGLYIDGSLQGFSFSPPKTC